jgi:His-Xaa-Ser system protein HxsD
MMEESSKSRFYVNERAGSVDIKVNSGIYPLDIIYSAAYSFTRGNYVILDKEGDDIIVELRPKEEKKDLEALGRDFLNSLIRFVVHKQNCEESKDTRYMFLQRALLINSPPDNVAGSSGPIQAASDAVDGGMEDFDLDNLDELIDDPDGIAVPWEEKYGKQKKGKKK